MTTKARPLPKKKQAKQSAQRKAQNSRRISVPKGWSNVFYKIGAPIGPAIVDIVKRVTMEDKPTLASQTIEYLIDAGLLPKPEPKITSIIDVPKVQEEVRQVNKLLEHTAGVIREINESIPKPLGTKSVNAQPIDPQLRAEMMFKAILEYPDTEQNRLIISLISDLKNYRRQKAKQLRLNASSSAEISHAADNNEAALAAILSGGFERLNLEG
jgi:hypothetical protein